MAKQTTYLEPQVKFNSPDQKAFLKLAAKKHKFHLAYGGGGSGKSFVILYLLLIRALKAPGSRHLVLRLTADSCRRTLFDKTLREVFEAVYPGLLARCLVSESEMHVTLPNGPDAKRPHDGGSIIFFNGLNDENRMTKVLGDEFSTIWFNECNEFSYNHVSILIGRLRQNCQTLEGIPLRNKMFFDCNPASKKSWEYLAFIQNINPADGNSLPHSHLWVACKLNPQNNLEHLGEDYIETMQATMSAADRLRYIQGDWASDNPNALFRQSDIDKSRIAVSDKATPEDRLAACPPLKRITINVDPATSTNKNSDLTGITVTALGENGHGYVLADLSGKYTPQQWADRVAQAYSVWQADRVVAEKNQGGEMVEHTLRTSHPNLPIKLVHASRGKETRAEPVSALYEQNKVHHVGRLDELETQMTEFGMPGATKSPDRMDAMVWGFNELMDLAGNHKPRGARQSKVRGLFKR